MSLLYILRINMSTFIALSWECKAILKGKDTTHMVQMGLGWILPYQPLFNETDIEMAFCQIKLKSHSGSTFLEQ